MYINFDLAAKRGLTEIDILTLQIIKQLKKEDERVDNLAMVLTDSFEEKMSEKGYIHKIKGKKNDLELSKYRLTKKGTKLLRDLTSYGDADEDDKKLLNWLQEIYSRRVTSVKENSKEALRRLHWFKIETEIEKNYLGALLSLVINDTYVEDVDDKRPFNIKFNEFKQNNPRAILSNKISNLFWTPPNHFAKEYQLEDSPLWNYYQTNKGFVENYWKQLKLK